MKYLFTLLIIFVISLMHGQEISYSFIAEYELHYIKDTSDSETIFTSEPFILYTGKELSLYISANKIAQDSLLYTGNAALSDLGLLMSMPRPSTKQHFIKNNQTQSLVAYESISSTLYSYSEDFKWDWKLESDTIILANHVLKKATTYFKGRDYIAWYSQEIPITDGPYKFSGLPGLIFKIYDAQKQFSIELLNYRILSKEKLLAISYDQNAKKTTEQKFKETKLKFYTDPFPLLESEGIFYPVDAKKRIRDKHRQYYDKSYDNKIELTN